MRLGARDCRDASAFGFELSIAAALQQGGRDGICFFTLLVFTAAWGFCPLGRRAFPGPANGNGVLSLAWGFGLGSGLGWLGWHRAKAKTKTRGFSSLFHLGWRGWVFSALVLLFLLFYKIGTNSFFLGFGVLVARFGSVWGAAGKGKASVGWRGKLDFVCGTVVWIQVRFVVCCIIPPLCYACT